MALAVYKVLIKKAYTEIVLNDIFEKNILDPIDVPLVTGVVNETVKMKRTIDHYIDKNSKQSIEKIDPYVLSVLRTAVAQLIFFDRIPGYAVVNESVKIIKRQRKYAAGYANAVLRKIISQKEQKIFPDIYIELSYETWMAKRWRERYDKDFAIDYMLESNKTPGTSIRVNKIKANIKDIKNIVISLGYEIINEYEKTGVLVLKKAPGIAGSDIYKRGEVVFQDEAAARICLFMDPRSEELVLDMCAAPGGKTFYISQLMNNLGTIHARDIYEWKVNDLNKESKRLGIKNVKLQNIDATKMIEEDRCRYDKILADVPCTGTGIIRKKPEIKWNRKLEDISDLNIIQKKILNNGFNYLKNGGELVYSTCSIEKEENEDIIEEFLKETKNAQLIWYKDTDKYLHLFPNIDGTDGFFGAKIKKSEEI